VKTQPILVRGGRVIDFGRDFDSVADVLLKDGAVAAVRRSVAAPDGARVVEAKGLVVCPGFVDLHCHLREPGYEDKETIATGTRAAAKGGFTTVCAMPNTRPLGDSPATVEYVLRKAREEGAVRVLPIGCVTKGSTGQELAEMGELAQAGVIGFSDDGRPVGDPNLMRQALGYSSAFGLPIINHCQVDELFQGGVMNEGWVATRLGLRGIPSSAEEVMVARDISLAALTGGRIHLAHVSTAGTVELVRRAKERGVQVTCEVTPHHLTLTEDAAMGNGAGRFGPLTPEGYNTYAKVNPPLRSRADVDAVVEGLRDGTIDVVATDHAPHNTVDKQCTFAEAAFGISVLETALGSLMSLTPGRVPLPRLVEALTAAPAKFLGRSDLGTLAKGAAADVVVFDPDAEWTVDARQFVSKGKNTPLDGATLWGRVVATIYGGQAVYEQTRGGPKAR
jgi:dihydroorotase